MKSFSVTIIEDSNSPTFLVGEDIIVNEDAGEVIISNWAKNIDDGDPGLDENLVFNIVSNSNPTLFEGAPVIDPLTGNLSFNTMLNMNGQGIIGVRLVDESGLESNLQHFNITIDPINDAPKFLVGSNINIDPGEGTQLIQGWATSISDGDPELAQSISFLITSNSNPSIFIDEPSINVLGDLIFTPSNQNTGTADIFVTLTDDGESNGDNVNQSEPQRFSITVNGPTGIPEAHNDFHLEAFPNPTNGNGYIIVALSERIYGKFSLQLMDLMGKKYYENSLMNSDSNVKLNWDMATLPNGLYVIKLVHKEMVIEQKIIKN